ncbi:hypothetical protein BBAD15_g2692 [Beauveria bassiana D1-5]|uniref:Uncharacterized protein n=1 Tax=Beauveria bassiana D1-5 TaxID=1245745 RepID=A0A0A2VZH4_BEABA|nr:hypothetical protein BBAD15_g2692 [Beauveria bassiana D1-5]
MKYTALLLGAGTIVSGLPQVSSCPKLPFKPAPEGSGSECPYRNGGYDEDECGTKRYCNAIGAFGKNATIFKTKPVWDTIEACTAAHEPEPEQELLPFDFGYSVDADCANRGLTETDCGTKFYCEQIDEIVKSEKSRGKDLLGEDNEQTEDTRFKSTDECFKAHVPEPKDLPFLEADEDNFCGSRGDESEETCGTSAFCDLFVGEKRQALGSPYIWSRQDCLNAHQKNPAAPAPTSVSNRLPENRS